MRNMTEAIGGPSRDRTKTISVTGIVGLTLALFTLGLRIWARITAEQFGMDDWIMVTGMVYIINQELILIAKETFSSS